MSDQEPAQIARTAGTRLRSAVWLPLFGELADPVVVSRLAAGTDPAPYAKAGATWWLTDFEPTVSLDQVRGVLRDGPHA
jgi:hypothetical protein